MGCSEGFNNFPKVYDSPNDKHVDGNWTFSDLKENHALYYYDRYKIHKLVVQSAEIKNFVETYYDYKYDEQNRVKQRFFIITKNGVKLDLDPDVARMYDAYQFDKPYFSSWKAAEAYLKKRVDYCNNKIRKAQETIDKYEKLKENYEKCHTEFVVGTAIEITSKLF